MFNTFFIFDFFINNDFKSYILDPIVNINVILNKMKFKNLFFLSRYVDKQKKEF